MRRILLVAALSLLPSTAVGDCFSVPLPDLVGVVDFIPSTGGEEATFDFGQQFSEIQNVWIEVEAQVFAQEYDVCGTLLDPQSCVHQVHLLGFFARMDKEDSPALGTVWSDGLSFSDGSSPFEGYGVDVARFNNPLVGWDFLLDGEGSLTLYWNRELGNPDRIIINVIEPSGEIFDARLIIEGTPIPEPATVLLHAASLLVLTGLKRWLRK
jgi:hypothetical protein